jgi:aryl carrier-like protein
MLSVCCWVKGGAAVELERLFRPPTILAWDLGAVYRILPIEARSP